MTPGSDKLVLAVYPTEFIAFWTELVSTAFGRHVWIFLVPWPSFPFHQNVDGAGFVGFAVTLG